MKRRGRKKRHDIACRVAEARVPRVRRSKRRRDFAPRLVNVLTDLSIATHDFQVPIEDVGRSKVRSDRTVRHVGNSTRKSLMAFLMGHLWSAVHTSIICLVHVGR